MWGRAKNYAWVLLTKHLFYCLATLQILSSACIAKTFKHQKSIKVGVWDELNQSMHPFAKKHESSRYIQALLLDPLIGLDEQGQLQCVQCKQLPSIQNKLIKLGADKSSNFMQSITFEIKENLCWGDGTAISGHDAYFSWQAGKSLRHRHSSSHLFEIIKDITVDPKHSKRFTIYFDKKNNYLSHLTNFYILPKHLEYKIWTKYQKSYLNRSLYKRSPTNSGLYSGLYKIKSIVGDRDMHLTANNNHPQAQPSLANIKAYALKGYKNKHSPKLDIYSEVLCNHQDCQSLNHQPPQKVKKVPNSYTLHWADSNKVELLALNLRNPLLKDQNIRQALAHSINKDQITQNLSKLAMPSASLFAPSHPNFNKQIKFYAFNLSQSKLLLENSGWIKTNNIFEKNDQQFTLTLSTSSKPNQLSIAKQLIKSWKKAGLSIRHKAYTSSAYKHHIKRMNYEGLALISLQLPLHESLRPLFHSSVIPTIRNNYRGQNIFAFNNKRLDSLLDTADKIFELKAYKGDMQAIQKILLQQLPFIPIFIELKTALVGSRVNGFSLPSHDQPSSLRASRWRLATYKLSAH